jgi:hypothetical protein
MTGDAQPRSARKRTAILDAATTVFLRKGYLGTSMDEVAALAAVSKQTVHKHFADKERLFAKIVIGTTRRPTASRTRWPTSPTPGTWSPTCATSPAASSRWSCSRGCSRSHAS